MVFVLAVGSNPTTPTTVPASGEWLYRSTGAVFEWLTHSVPECFGYAVPESVKHSKTAPPGETMTAPSPELRERIENTIRFLAVDAVERASSGHPVDLIKTLNHQQIGVIHATGLNVNENLTVSKLGFGNFLERQAFRWPEFLAKHCFHFPSLVIDVCAGSILYIKVFCRGHGFRLLEKGLRTSGAAR